MQTSQVSCGFDDVLLGCEVYRRSNININDVLGNYSLTLIDSLDALLILGNTTEFHRAVHLVSQYTSFDQDVTVQVFEATIRVLGGLLSAHVLLTDDTLFPAARLAAYDNELLDLARDLIDRLSDAFQGVGNYLPVPRINLRHGIQMMAEKMHETCLAGAGSLVLEWGVASRLTGDEMYENMAKRAMLRLWEKRSRATGLLGNSINVALGEWIDKMSGVGAGMDSYYEYLLKAYILFGDEEYLKIFNEAYAAIKQHQRVGPFTCGTDATSHPLFINVNMDEGNSRPSNFWIDALGAAFPGVQVLAGDLQEAVCLHNFYMSIWKRYGVLPERFDWFHEHENIPLYPLRPELAESTYFLYRATKNPLYLHVGKWMVEGINSISRVKCGFATVHNFRDRSLEDRMESFFLSETLKYLYLLFDEDNFVNRNAERIIFTTEGHIFPILAKFQKKPADQMNIDLPDSDACLNELGAELNDTLSRYRNPADTACPALNPLLPYALPVEEITWKENAVPLNPPLCSG
ncbi:ER degradation-enhancing alpha-mannosidase-like protein 1 isoform X2 [Paramacrobiotus metropolitanus]|uniref:ER degradation-enhancing alpha-mannosidase-like protein 1 isoform X2 n=1 Tax=Paramacrobiotus metropolitanus TaxID=2943436 RepID=UPI002445621D|nr:ER degradation-enhancing alpha-mannosidase-like protein 1 isoform X2 [Paramacrobiotus metropolitanus]